MNYQMNINGITVDAYYSDESIETIFLPLLKKLADRQKATLAASAFPALAMATVPGAIFSVWHNISGAILAGILRRTDQKHKQP